ncbi:MAG: hypothetical protein U0894_02500 [Pirellulales bacterium]
MLSPEFLPFIQGAPCAVMTRLAAEWLLDEAINELFDMRSNIPRSPFLMW